MPRWPRPASPASAARASSRRSRSSSSPASSPPTASSTAPSPTRSPRIEPQGRTFTYVVREGEPRIAITQADIRAIQLAKAALYAGIRLLMDHYPVDRVDRIVLAGAFGSHIDVKYAMVLGLIPDCPLDNVRSAGNAAGTGARIALLNARVAPRDRRQWCAASSRSRRRWSRASRSTSSPPWRSRTRPTPFPNLSEAVTLPARATSATSERRRRRGG